MKQQFKGIASEFKREFQRIFHDEGMVVFLLIVPLVYPLLYSYLYSNQVVREVPIVAVDNSNSHISRKFLRMVNATPEVDVIRRIPDINEAKRAIAEGEAYGIIYLPKELNQRINQNNQVHISIFCDMSGLLYYKSLLEACTNVSLTLNQKIRIERLSGLTAYEQEVQATPITYTNVAFFNPEKGFDSFLIPGILMLIIQQTLLLGLGLKAGTNRDKGVKRERISVGNFSAYLSLYLFTTGISIHVVNSMFGLEQLANPVDLSIFLLFYISTCIAFAFSASRLVPNRESCMLIFVITSVPLLFLSGISWPASNIPDWLKAISYIFPSTFGINGYIELQTMGASLTDILPKITALSIQLIIYLIIASKSISYRRI